MMTKQFSRGHATRMRAGVDAYLAETLPVFVHVLIVRHGARAAALVGGLGAATQWRRERGRVTKHLLLPNTARRATVPWKCPFR